MYLVTTNRAYFIGVLVAYSPNGLDQMQTVGPWVSILLLSVLSIHLLQGLAISSNDDPELKRTIFIASVFYDSFIATWEVRDGAIEILDTLARIGKLATCLYTDGRVTASPPRHMPC
jgi:hypothetical protein